MSWADGVVECVSSSHTVVEFLPHIQFHHRTHPKEGVIEVAHHLPQNHLTRRHMPLLSAVAGVAFEVGALQAEATVGSVEAVLAVTDFPFPVHGHHASCSVQPWVGVPLTHENWQEHHKKLLPPTLLCLCS